MKTNHSRIALLCFSLLGGAVAGCSESGGEPASPNEASARAGEAAPQLTESYQQTLAVLDSQRFQDLDQLLNTLSGFSGGDETAASLTSSALRMADGDGDELQGLADQLFTESNHEGGGVYRVPASLLCDAADLECVDLVTEAELRVRAVLLGDDGLELTLLVGPDRDAPLIVELSPTLIAGTADLREIADAAVFLASLQGQSLDVPAQIDGRIRGSFEALEGGGRIAVAITEALAVAGDIGGQYVSLSVAARDPLYALSVDFAARSVTIDIDVGPVALQAPWTALDAAAASDDTIEIDWQGASATVTLDSAEQLVLSNLGLGDGSSTVKVGDALVASLDLNADSGRRFDMTLSAGDQGPRVAVQPGIDLELFVDASVVDDTAPAHLSGVTYRAALSGAAPAVELIDTGLDQLVKVMSGTVEITASDAAEAVVAEPGDCLTGGLEPEPEDHPVLGTMAVATCPATVAN